MWPFESSGHFLRPTVFLTLPPIVRTKRRAESTSTTKSVCEGKKSLRFSDQKHSAVSYVAFLAVERPQAIRSPIRGFVAVCLRAMNFSFDFGFWAARNAAKIYLEWKSL